MCGKDADMPRLLTDEGRKDMREYKKKADKPYTHKTMLRRAAWLLTAVMLSINIWGGGIVFAQDAVSIRVDQDDLLDVVLTLGQTDSDVSNVEADLTAALVAKGVPADKINIQAVEASEVSAGNTSSGWEIYDHTNYNDTSVIPYYRPYYSETNGNYVLSRHIVPSTGGATNIDFYGYGAPAYKDFMYMPNAEFGKKTFDFTIQEGEFYDALNGAGFIFNTSMTPNTDLASRRMSGYLVFFNYPGSAPPPSIEIYKFTNVDVNSFHNSSGTTIQAFSGFQKIASYAVGSEKTRAVKIETTSGTFKMWYNGTLVNFSLTAGGTATEVPLDTDFGAYGFGPLVGYLSHGCARHTHFTFYNVTMTKESSKRFSEVIREPEWRNVSKRFIVNAQDGVVADFSDPAALGEILSRLGNENIHYIGWGRDDADGNAFIAKNDGNGVFVDKDAAATDTYAEQIQAMADYIYGEYADSVVNDTEHLIYGKPSSLSITPESEKNNTVDADWPNGKWRVEHEEAYYQNPTGAVPYDGLYLNNLDISFTEAGKYEIYYQDTLAKTVYVHRKPVAGFNISVDGSLNVTITGNAYDPDYEAAPDKGIASETWQYRETTSTVWIDGQPASFMADKDYVVRQIVTDNDGVASDPYYRYISTATDSGIVIAPMAEFRMAPDRLLTYISETVAYTDTSYDPQGRAITEKLWKVTKDGAEIYSGAAPKVSFTGAAAGTYKITLKVKNVGNVWSEPVARYLTVVRDDVAPTAASDTADGSFNTPKVIQLTFADEVGGSGFSHRYAVVTGTTAMPADWGSMGTNETYSVAVNSLGAHYIHYKAHDYAGNIKTGYFGPFIIADTTGPSEPVITMTPAYTPGSWINQSVTVSADSATDDFTAQGDIAYAVSTDGTNYTDSGNVALDSDGTHTVYFKVTDGSGNDTVVARTVKIDQTAPDVPAIAMQSGGSAYTEDTWATQNVSITLSGSADALSGLSGYQYRIGDGGWQDGNTYTFNTSGQYTFAYRARDNAGNFSAEGSRSVKVDLEAPGEPTIGISPAYASEWANQSVTLTAELATDDMTAEGDIFYEVSSDGTEYTPGHSVTLEAEGTHTVYFRVTDEGGNQTTVSRTVKIDKTAPDTPAIAMESGGAAYTESTWAVQDVAVTLSGAADTGGSGLAGYQYKIGDGAWQDGGACTFGASGQYTLYYRAIDGAGNTSAELSKTIWVDMDAPEVFAVTTSSTAIDSIRVSASTTDAHSGLAADAYRIYNGTEWSAWKATVNETLKGYERGETVTVKVQARDNAGNVREVETTATTLINTAPAAANDSFTVAEDAGRTRLSVLSNDHDGDTGDSVAVSGVSGLSNSGAGRVEVSNGGVYFTPAPDYHGAVSFTYTIKDTAGAKATATATVTVAPVNDPPTAANDAAVTNEDQSVTVNVLANDRDIDSELRIVSAGGASSGAVTKAGSSLRYVPSANYYGSDSFSYTVTDGEYSATVQVSVTIKAVNDAPMLAPDRASTDYERPVDIPVLANDSDVETAALTISSVSAPAHGTARASGSRITYTPVRGFSGADTFSYTVTDEGIKVSAAVTVEVRPPAAGNTGTGAGTGTIFNPGGITGGMAGGNTGGTSGGTTGGAAGGTNGGAAGGQGFTVLTQPSKGTTEQVDGGILYTPAEGQSGIDTYSIVVEDENGEPTEYQVVVNTDPETGETTTIGYGIPLSEGGFEADENNEFKVDLSAYNVTSIEDITINGEPLNGTIRIEDGVLIYTPEDGFAGLDALVITVDTPEGPVPLVATFKVLGASYRMDPEKTGGFPWVCMIGWIAAGILLLLNFLRHREYYQEKRKRWILYITASVALLAALCILRLHLGYIFTGVIALMYILVNYLYAGARSKKTKD